MRNTNYKRSFLTILFVTATAYTIACTKIDFQVEANKVTRSCVNLIDENRLQFNVRLDLQGKVVQDNSYSCVTDYLIVNNGSRWYQKTIYLQTCCEIDGVFDFCAERVVFYDYKRSFLNSFVIDNPQAAIEIPSNAYFAKVQFSEKSTKYYAAITNRSVKNNYTPYSVSNLYKCNEKLYEKVSNTDGAISLVLSTGYDYIGRNLGFGSYHTAYNTNCIKAESYDGSYTGLKYQIDCSAFAELALTGVPYNDSRYFKGNDFDNVSIDGSFRFDSFAEYNYYMLQFSEECGADYGRMYANKLAKYFYDRGYLYEVEKDFSNVQVGDLLFWGSKTDEYDFFYDITHVAICCDVWKRKDGINGIRVLETASEEVKEYQDKMRYGARPDLPDRDIDKKEMLSSIQVNTENISIHGEGGVQVAILFLKESLEVGEVYTLSILCDIPSDCIITCKINNGKTTIGKRDYLESYSENGIIIKHFGIGKGLLGDDSNKIYVYLYSQNSAEGNVIIKDVSIMKGYHHGLDII